MMFIDLPDVIFALLQNYLTNDDYHYLLNASRQYFGDLKRRTIYFRLNAKKSKEQQRKAAKSRGSRDKKRTERRGVTRS